MTEHRSHYQAKSGDYSTDKGTVSPLYQHYVNGTVARDIILLLPVLQSPLYDESPSSCMHLVHLPDGLGFCNASTEQHCTCCGLPVCNEHCRGFLSLRSEMGEGPLCETCTFLPVHIISALRTFRHLMNEQKGQVEL